MKNKLDFEKRPFDDIVTGTDNVQLLVEFLETFTASTYPIKTLRRRFGFLRPTELARIRRLETRLFELAEEYDDIISSRAEKENDSWP